MDNATVIDFNRFKTSAADQRAARLESFQQAQKAETVRRTRLEWVLADLLADIQTA